MKNTNKFAFQLVTPLRTVTDINGKTQTFYPIYRTKNYDIIQFLHGLNRPVRPSHVSEIGASITEWGILRDMVVVLIDGIFYWADGQHQAVYQMQIGIDLQFKLIEVKNKEIALGLIAAMNSSSTRWSLEQFINAWATLYGKDYKQLRAWKKEHHLTWTHAAMLLSGSTKATVKGNIENGTFRTLNVATADRFVACIDNFYNTLAANGLERYSYTTEGLIDFILERGLDNYIAIEQIFVKAAQKEFKKMPVPVFARRKDMENFLLKVYHKVI